MRNRIEHLTTPKDIDDQAKAPHEILQEVTSARYEDLIGEIESRNEELTSIEDELRSAREEYTNLMQDMQQIIRHADELSNDQTFVSSGDKEAEITQIREQTKETHRALQDADKRVRELTAKRNVKEDELHKLIVKAESVNLKRING